MEINHNRTNTGLERHLVGHKSLSTFKSRTAACEVTVLQNELNARYAI